MVRNETLINATNRLKKSKIKLARSTQVSESTIARLERAAESQDNPVYQFRPYKHEGGVRQAIPFLNNLHEFERKWLVLDRTPTSAYEIWHEDGVVSFNIVPGSPRLAPRIRDQLFEDYPNSEIRPRTRQFPEFEVGNTLYGARFGLLRGNHLPIRHPDIDGYGGEKDDVRDPYKNVLTRMTGDDDATIQLQAAFRPRRVGPLFRGKAGRAARKLEAGYDAWDWARLTKVHVEPDAADETAASIIRGEGDSTGERSFYEVAVRLLVGAADKEVAKRRYFEVVRALNIYYEGHVKQGFAGHPVWRYKPFLREVGERMVEGGPGKNLVESRALSGLVHGPAPGVNNAGIDRSQTKAGNPVPPRTPRFDFEALLDQLGRDQNPEELTPAERFRLMVRHGHECPGETDDAIWIGEGTRAGTEAGIPIEDLLHLLIPGMTGGGKTTMAHHIFYQLLERDGGAFWGDPKDGEDAMLACALAILAGRGDDLIPIRVGTDTDNRITFNFLEVPGTDEPGTSGYRDKLEVMSDVVEGVLAQAGGTNRSSWGERMSGITRHMSRGLGQMELDPPATLMTMNYAGATETDRERYAEHVAEQNIPFIEDTARDVFAEYDSSSVEPWARRVNQVVESAPLREIACNPYGISLTDAMREGKIIVLFGETASNTALKMLNTAVMLHLWTIRQELVHSDDPANQDLADYHVFMDELNDVVTPQMNLPQVLSNARSYGFHLHGIFQDPTSQTGEDVTAAFEGQADILSVYPGREDLAKSVSTQHSDDVGVKELMDLPDYRIFLRTRDGLGERTHSYPVDLGYPIMETEDEMPDMAEVRELVESVEQELGSPRRTPEQIKSDDPFATAPGEESETESAPDTLTFTEATERATVQAVYDTMLRTGQDAVSVEAVLPALKRRVESFDGDEQAAFQKLIRPTDTVSMAGGNRVTVSDTDAETAITDIGTSRSNGGITHTSLMWDAYAPLTKAGLDVTINRSGGSSADAIARRIPDPAEPELVDRLLGDGDEARVEAESTTGDQQPGVTVHHVMQGLVEGRRTIVLTRPDKAHRVENTLRNDPPLCRSVDPEAGETQFYTSTATISFNGNEVFREGPKGETNVWLRDDDTGEILLRDPDGTVHGRFDTPDAVFSDPDGYLTTGECRVKAPVIPEAYATDTDDPADAATITETPIGASEPSDLSVEGYPTDWDGGVTSGVTADALGVPERAVTLLGLLADREGVVTVTEGHDLAGDHDIDVSRKTVDTWINGLVDAGVLTLAGTGARGVQQYEVVSEPPIQPEAEA